MKATGAGLTRSGRIRRGEPFSQDRLEDGSIEVNGAGALLTSEACLLNPDRNPTMSRAQIEQRLRDYLGVTDILWLGDGIEGDDTDGHVDDLARFVSERTLLPSSKRTAMIQTMSPCAKIWPGSGI